MSGAFTTRVAILREGGELLGISDTILAPIFPDKITMRCYITVCNLADEPLRHVVFHHHPEEKTCLTPFDQDCQEGETLDLGELPPGEFRDISLGELVLFNPYQLRNHKLRLRFDSGGGRHWHTGVVVLPVPQAMTS